MSEKKRINGQRFWEAGVMLAETVMRNNSPIISEKWQYDCGLTLLGIGALYEKGGDSRYFDYIKNILHFLSIINIRTRRTRGECRSRWSPYE